MRRPEVLRLEPWNKFSYLDALARQHELAQQGRAGWLVFACPPTITLGRRARDSDVRVSPEQLVRLGVQVQRVDRGGEVTFHGPGQVVGFPFGKLENHVGDPRGVRAFVHRLKATLEEYLALELSLRGETSRHVDLSTPEETAGVWLAGPDGEPRRKIVSIGLAFGREGISHGFALNLAPVKGFELIVACGDAKAALPASLLGPGEDAAFEPALGRLIDILQRAR